MAFTLRLRLVLPVARSDFGVRCYSLQLPPLSINHQLPFHQPSEDFLATGTPGTPRRLDTASKSVRRRFKSGGNVAGKRGKKNPNQPAFPISMMVPRWFQLA